MLTVHYKRSRQVIYLTVSYVRISKKEEEELDLGDAEADKIRDEEDEEASDTCAMRKSEEILRYREFQYDENPKMRLTGEDLQVVLECDHCGPDLTEEVRKDCDGCGSGWGREDYTLTIVGNDVVSLFPSLDSVTTGKIVRGEVTRSTMEIDGFETKLGLRYIVMNEQYTSDLGPLRRLLPTRITKPGIQPTMKCKWVNHKEVLDDDDWVYPPLTPTKEETRLIVGHVAEIGTRVIFENMVYQFGGVAYHQQQGGPIGARVTMCAARMVMQHWARGYAEILLQAGLRLPLFGGYVDDGRQGSTALRRGMMFDQEQKKFIFDEEQKRIDDELNEPDNRRMARVCLPAMNSVNPNLTFTTECPEDFQGNRLPTLDFVLWMVRGTLFHSYYEKSMRLQYTILQRSAMGQHQKMAILGNELIRRLSNIHSAVLEEEIEPVVEHYIGQMKNSGYSRKETKEVIVCGLVGWRRKLERRRKAGKEQFLTAEETLEKRTKDKMLEKTSWYKTNLKRKAEDKDSEYQYTPAIKKKRRGQAGKHTINGKKTTNNKIKGVMFVPFTKHSELATRLREGEEHMEKMTGYRIKIVERGGTKLVDILHKANPWAGEDCQRPGCLMCSSKRSEGKRNAQDCRRRNCVYETICLTCKRRQDKELEDRMEGMDKKKIEEERKKIKRYIYIGETNRSTYERGLEHTRDIQSYAETSDRCA